MDVLYPYCAGLAVHKVRVVACRLSVDRAGRNRKVIEPFGTTTAALLRLSAWLAAGQCTPVAMESTGEVWKPVGNIREGSFELRLINAQPIKRGPGRKTEVQDADWLAELRQHGLVTASFIPPRAHRERRALTRQRPQ